LSNADVRVALWAVIVVRQLACVEPTKVRPPLRAGGWRPFDPELAAVAKELSLKINNWDIDTRDWEDPKGLGEKELYWFAEGLRLARPRLRPARCRVARLLRSSIGWVQAASLMRDRNLLRG
jgi:hypothetical protein